MLPWELLATASAPQGDTLRLLRRGTEYSIRLEGGNELMNSRLGGSEESLATLTLDRIGARSAPRLLIGGLGMGFTLRAALAATPAAAQVVVSEIVPDLIGWARGPMAEVFGGCLEDPRVQLRAGDVAAEIRTAAPPYDAILLDVDNGPDGLTRAGNDGLYGEAGLRAAHRALSPGGVLAVWSAAPDPAFTRRLGRCGFHAETHSVPAGRGKRGPRHIIWTARR